MIGRTAANAARALLIVPALFCFALLPTFAVLPEKGTPDQDDIHLAISRDASRFTVHPAPLFRKGSSPELIRLGYPVGDHESGVYLLYFVDFSAWTGQAHQERLAMAWSRDGVTWSEKKTLRFDDPFFEGRATDPSLVQLDNGRLRVYFMTPGRTRGSREIRSATSEDGESFVMDSGVRISATGNVDVDRHGDKWYLFLGDESRNVTLMATSADGLFWTWDDDFQIPGTCPGVLPFPDGSARLYVNDGGISLYRFDSRSGTCRRESANVLPAERGMIGDPSPVWSDTRILLAYKRRTEPGLGAQGLRPRPPDPSNGGPPPTAPRPGDPGYGQGNHNWSAPGSPR